MKIIDKLDLDRNNTAENEGTENSAETIIQKLALKNKYGYGKGLHPTVGNLDETVTANFCNILSETICTENLHPTKLFLYHGTGSSSFLLNLVYTLYSSLNDGESEYSLRPNYKKCNTIPNVGYDLDPSVQECLVSTNLSLVSNIWTPGESTMSYFINATQATSLDLTHSLNRFYQDLYTDLNIPITNNDTEIIHDIIDEIEIMNDIMKCSGTGILLQIGIEEDVFNQVARLSGSYGFQNLGFDKVPERLPNDITQGDVLLRALKYEPDLLIPYITFSEVGSLDAYENGITTYYNRRLPQYRLFLKNGIMNSDKVVIIPYAISNSNPNTYCSEDAQQNSDNIEILRQSNNKVRLIKELISKSINNHIRYLLEKTERIDKR